MSVGYTAIQWNNQKKRYDLAILIFSGGFLIIYILMSLVFKPGITLETLLIRALGSLAILLLHIVLVIGPLSRLDSRFLVLLYNRRHLGVTTFFIGLLHGIFSLLNFHTGGNLNPVKSLFVSNTHYGSFIHFPFEILGVASLGTSGCLCLK